MTGFASATGIRLVVGTAKILDAVVLCVGMIPKLTAAIGTIDEVTEYTLLVAVLLCSPLSLACQLLYLLKGISVNDRLVSVLEDCPILFAIGNTGFVALSRS